MALPIIPLISAGASLLGGLFGKKKQTQTTSQTVDYGRLVEDAQEAGFNPLTALRAGGAAGFTQTHNPVLAQNFFGKLMDGVQMGAGLYQDWQSQNAAAARQGAEMDLINAQIRNINGQTKSMGGLGSVLSAGVPNRRIQPVAPLGKPQNAEAGKKTVTNPYQVYDVDPSTSDVEIKEARYGDVGGTLFAPGTMWDDWAINNTTDHGTVKITPQDGSGWWPSVQYRSPENSRKSRNYDAFGQKAYEKSRQPIRGYNKVYR